MTKGPDPNGAREARPVLHTRTIVAILLELGVCALVLVFTLSHWHAWSVALAMVVIATRQHALFILYHDAVHVNVARDRRLNDLITNLLIGVPQLVPVEVYRRLHLAHHARLGTEADPERILLYRDQPWDYRPLGLWALTRQLAGDLFMVNNLRTLKHFSRELRDPHSVLALPPLRMFPELWVIVALFTGLAVAGLVVDAEIFARFALLWFVPLVTLTQAIQKVRSFVEHAPMDAPKLTYSWRPGWFGRFVLWPYHINYHREHHVHPRVPWYRLPQTFPHVVQRPGSSLWSVLWSGRR